VKLGTSLLVYMDDKLSRRGRGHVTYPRTPTHLQQ